MNVFRIEVANQVIEVDTLHTRTGALSRRFLTNKTPDFRIQISQNDIDKEKDQYKKLFPNVTDPWDGFIEVSVVLRKLCDELINRNTLMIHGVAIESDNKSIIFSAPSGTGKTTFALKWLEKKPESLILNGDKPFIKVEDLVYVCGSPWAGKENLYTNRITVLDAIVFMERADENYIEEIDFSQAFLHLFQQTYRPDDQAKMIMTLKLLQSINGKIRFFIFHFNNYRDNCVEVAYNTLIGS